MEALSSLVQWYRKWESNKAPKKDENNKQEHKSLQGGVSITFECCMWNTQKVSGNSQNSLGVRCFCLKAAVPNCF